MPRIVVRGIWAQPLSLSPLPVLRAGSPGSLPTCGGRGLAGVGTRHFQPAVLGADDWVWVCMVGMVSACLCACVAVLLRSGL